MNTLNDIIRTLATSFGIDPDGPDGVAVTLATTPEKQGYVAVVVSSADDTKDDLRIANLPGDYILHDLVR